MIVELLTVEQLAQMLDMHPRTIRRYIRENQLKASKVGGEWRIRREDAEMFIGGRINEIKADSAEEIQSFISGQTSVIEGKNQVCTIFDYYVDTPEEARKISEVFMHYMNESTPNHGQAKFQYFYDDVEKKGRYTIWGNPNFVGRVLIAVSEVIS